MPMNGKIFTAYTLFYLLHKAIIAFFLPYRLGFEDEPSWGIVFFDMYLDVVFFADIVITFHKPVSTNEGHTITDKRVIAFLYLKTWFVLDLIACFPHTFFRKRSQDWPRDKDDVKNFLTLNYKSLPRFYYVLLATKMIRIRQISSYL